MSKKNNEENIQFDRDTTKPEQKLVKKTKKVDGTTQTKKEENLQKQSKSNLIQEDKGIQNSSPQNKQQQGQKTSKNKDDDSDDEEEENEEEEEEEENEEDEESENEKGKQPLTIRNKKMKDDNNNNPNNKEYYNDSELKQLLKNLKPIKPETTEKEIQCEIEKEQITQLTTQFESDLKEKENQHQQEIINIQNKFNIKESEYLLQLDQNKKELEFEKTTKIDTISKLQKEIDIKDKNLKQLSNTNTKLRKSLSELSQQVNTLFTQLTSTKKVLQIHEEEKAKRQKENNDSETALQAKEKELQNTFNLVNILSKDNKKLQKMLDTYGDYNKKIELSDKVKYKDQNIEQLKQEVKKLKLLLDKHKKCENEKADYEKEIIAFKKEEEIAKEQISALKKEIISLKRQSLSPAPQNNSNKKSIFQSSSSSTNLKVKKQLYIDKKSDSNNLLSQNGDKNSNSNQKHYMLASISTKNKTQLLNEDEIKALSSYFDSSEKYDTFIKKIQVLEKYRMITEEKNMKNVSLLKETIAERNEQIEYLQHKNNENEMKLRISENTIKDNKNNIKIYQKKINDQQKFIDTLLNNIKKQELDSLKVSTELDAIKNELQEIKCRDKEKIIIDLDTMISQDKKYVEILKSNKLKEIDELINYKDDIEQLKNVTNHIEPLKSTNKEYIIAMEVNENKKNEEENEKNNEKNNDEVGEEQIYEEKEEVIVNEEQQLQENKENIQNNNEQQDEIKKQIIEVMEQKPINNNCELPPINNNRSSNIARFKPMSKNAAKNMVACKCKK